MILKSLRTNQLSTSAMAWYECYLQALEARDSEIYLTFLSQDVVMQINDRVPYYGHGGVLSSLQEYFGAFDRIEYEPLNIYGADHDFAVEMLTHFKPVGRADSAVVPNMSFYTRDSSGLLTSVRRQVDDTALSA